MNEYLAAGAQITDDLSTADAIIGRDIYMYMHVSVHSYHTPTLYLHTPMNVYEYCYM